MTSQLTSSIVVLIILHASASASSIDCGIEDFEDNSLGSFGEQCLAFPSASLFDVLKYDRDFEVPDDSIGEHYAKPAEGSVSCIRHREMLSITEGTEFTLYMYKKGLNENRARCFVFAFDAASDSSNMVLDVEIIDVYGDGAWIKEDIKFNYDMISGKIRLEIVCDNMNEKDAIFAIDYIKIGSSIEEDCKTTTPPSTTITTPLPSTITTLPPSTITTPLPSTITTLPPSTISTPPPSTITPSPTSTITPSPPSSTTPKPPSNSNLTRTLIIIVICFASFCLIWITTLTISACLKKIPALKPAVDNSNSTITTIPRLHVHKIQITESGNYTIDISGSK